MLRPELVICFGDSLTEGFQSPTRDNPTGKGTPYGHFLQGELGRVAEVRVSGVCGELTADMVARFGRDVLDHKPDYVLILSGTNDLGWNIAPAAIMRNLVAMFTRTLEAGGLPIPITVPSIRVKEAQRSREGREWVTDHLERLRQLNGLIRECARLQGLPCVDLFAATVDPDSGQLADIYSNDGIHLTTTGYRLLARESARVLTPLVSRGVEM